MEAEPPTVPEGLPTQTAGVRLFSRMDAEVPRECPRVAEASIAHGAGIWPLASVDALVDLQVLHAVKIAAAQRAVVGAAAWREGLPSWMPAGFRPVDLVLTVVLAPVPPQLLLQVKRLSANAAGVCPGGSGSDAGLADIRAAHPAAVVGTGNGARMLVGFGEGGKPTGGRCMEVEVGQVSTKNWRISWVEIKKSIR